MGTTELKDIYRKLKSLEDGMGEDALLSMLDGDLPPSTESQDHKYFTKSGGYSKKGKDFLHFFESKYPNTKKDIFRNVVYTKDIDVFKGWSPIENHISYIEADCFEVGLDPRFSKRYLSRWIAGKKPELLEKIPKWDGKDHIGDALSRIRLKSISVTHDHFVELMKEWFSLVVRRMHSPKIQNRLVIFRGRQGMGKDFSIRAMLSGFGRYANEINFDNHSKVEIYRTIKNLAVGIIPEFDETNRSSLSTLKSVITAESVEMRGLYEKQSEAVPIKTSFISASNFDNVLRDPSGNRRFLIFDLDYMEHTFDKVDGPQLLAQAFKLAELKYKASKEAQKAMKAIIDAETPENPEGLFIEEAHAYLRSRMGDASKDKLDSYNGELLGSENIPEPRKLRWFQIADDISRIAKKYGYSIRRAQQILKKSDAVHRDAASTFYAIH